MIFDTGAADMNKVLLDLQENEEKRDTNLELSDEFLTTVLKIVDELCDFIRNGDPDIGRTREINQKLTNAVNYYRIKVLDDNCKNDHSPARSLDSDTEYVVPIKKKKRKKIKKIKHQEITNQILENEGKIKFADPAKKEFKKKRVGRPKTLNPEDIIEIGKLLPFIKASGSSGFDCSFCNRSFPEKKLIFRHLNVFHHSEIKSTSDFKETNPNQHQVFDCKNRICRKIYGIKRESEWCRECIELSKLPKKPRRLKKVTKQVLKPQHAYKICPECGLSVFDLKSHLNIKHYGEKQICSQCNKELPCLSSLQEHIKRVHEKVPCPQCGEMFAITLMKRHTESKHTPNNQKKHQCEICGKGFAAKQNFEDHKNIHTGEKPYKCKQCTTSFASKANLLMHERSHRGYRRDYSKVRRKKNKIEST